MTAANAESAGDFLAAVIDASYAALAQRLELPFITADNPLAQKLADTEITVVSLLKF